YSNLCFKATHFDSHPLSNSSVVLHLPICLLSLALVAAAFATFSFPFAVAIAFSMAAIAALAFASLFASSLILAGRSSQAAFHRSQPLPIPEPLHASTLVFSQSFLSPGPGIIRVAPNGLRGCNLTENFQPNAAFQPGSVSGSNVL